MTRRRYERIRASTSADDRTSLGRLALSKQASHLQHTAMFLVNAEEATPVSTVPSVTGILDIWRKFIVYYFCFIISIHKVLHTQMEVHGSTIHYPHGIYTAVQ